MQSFLPTLVGVVAVIYIALLALQRLTQDEEEPRTICDEVPFVTPVFGIIFKDLDFHRALRRMFIANSRTLIAAVQSQCRTLCFTAVVATIGANLVGVSKATNEIIGRDKTQDTGYLMSFPKYVHHALSEGSGLDAMNRKSAQVLADSVDTLAKETTPKTVKMLQWIHHELFIATADAQFRANAHGVYSQVMAKGFSKKAYQAREHMMKAWEIYFDEGWYKQGSTLIKARVETNDDFQIPLKETARRNPDRAALLEEECVIEPMILHDDSDGQGVAINAHRFLHFQHTDHDVWGDYVDAFNHRRFLREPSGGGRSQSVNPFAFRAFGGGTTLCPGRHFATTEMMVLTALLALRFDVHPTNGKWAAPTTHNTPAASAMLVPD
ncbi:aminotransferase class I and II domain-containing protein [Apiospora arundinis]